MDLSVNLSKIAYNFYFNLTLKALLNYCHLTRGAKDDVATEIKGCE